MIKLVSSRFKLEFFISNRRTIIEEEEVRIIYPISHFIDLVIYK